MRISLYVADDTWLHRLDPMSKVLMTVAGVSLTFIVASPKGGAVLLLALLSLLGSGRVLLRATPVYAGMAVIGFTFVLAQGLVHPGNVEPLLHVTGPVMLYKEGLVVGLSLALRLYNILSATLILMLATNPSDLTESFVQRGLSPRFGYVIMAVLQIIPTMISASSAVADAQRSRGMETEGKLWTRVRAFIPLLGPLVTGSLIATEERALALEVRGFGGRRRPTFLKEQPIPPYAGVVRLLCFALLALGIVGRWQWAW